MFLLPSAQCNLVPTNFCRVIHHTYRQKLSKLLGTSNNVAGSFQLYLRLAASQFEGNSSLPLWNRVFPRFMAHPYYWLDHHDTQVILSLERRGRLGAANKSNISELDKKTWTLQRYIVASVAWWKKYMSWLQIFLRQCTMEMLGIIAKPKYIITTSSIISRKSLKSYELLI